MSQWNYRKFMLHCETGHGTLNPMSVISGTVEDGLPPTHTQCSWLYLKPENNYLGPSKVREAQFLLCVCMRGRQTERYFYKESSQNPKMCSWQAGNPASLMVQFQSESQKVETWKTQCFNWVWKEEKKKSVPSWRQLGRRNSLLSP